MKKKKDYEEELINEVSKDRDESIKREKVNKIRQYLLQSVEKEKSFNQFLKNSNLKFKKLSNSDFVHTVLEIQRSIFINRNEWYSEFLESEHYKKAMSIIEPVNGVGPILLKRMELRKHENNPDYIYYQLLDSKNTEYDVKLKVKFANQYKEILSGYPELNKFINDSFHSIEESHHQTTRFLFENIQELESDRIYLIELSKIVDDEKKYKIIINGISNGNFAISKLKSVEKYLFNKIVNKNLKKGAVKQLVEFIYKELKKLGGKTYDQTYIQKELYKLKK